MQVNKNVIENLYNDALDLVENKEKILYNY